MSSTECCFRKTVERQMRTQEREGAVPDPLLLLQQLRAPDRDVDADGIEHMDAGIHIGAGVHRGR